MRPLTGNYAGTSLCTGSRTGTADAPDEWDAKRGLSPASNQPSAPDQHHHPVIDTSVAHTARVWNYWLGGKDNYPVDHEVGQQIRARTPGITDIARASRGFLLRAVRHLAGEVGIRQFLDIGTGLPTVTHTHEVAQAIAPASRIVYVDNDPLVLTHARALLTSNPQGSIDHLDVDLRDPRRSCGTLPGLWT